MNKFTTRRLINGLTAIAIIASSQGIMAQKPIAVPTTKRENSQLSKQKPVSVPKPTSTNKGKGTKGSSATQSAPAKKKNESAEELFKKTYGQAVEGDANAQYTLGNLYFSGQGVTADKKKAFHWWYEAADQGMAAAQLNVGMCYHEGIGTSQDFDKAITWYKELIANSRATEEQKSDAREYIDMLTPDTPASVNIANYNYPSVLNPAEIGTHMFGVLPMESTPEQVKEWGRAHNYKIEESSNEVSLWLRNEAIPFRLPGGYTPKTICFKAKYKSGQTPYCHNWIQFTSSSIAKNAAEAAANNLREAGFSVTKDGDFWKTRYRGATLMIYYPKNSDHYTIDLHQINLSNLEPAPNINYSSTGTASNNYSSSSTSGSALPARMSGYQFGTHVLGMLPIGATRNQIINWCNSNGYKYDESGDEIGIWLRGSDIPFALDGGYRPSTVRMKYNLKGNSSGYIHNWFDFSNKTDARKAAEAAAKSIINSGIPMTKNGDFWQGKYQGRSIMVYSPDNTYFSIDLHP